MLVVVDSKTVLVVFKIPQKSLKIQFGAEIIEYVIKL